MLQFPRVAFLCTLIKREVIEKIGGLDERFTPGNFEDDDFCLRAQLAGYKTVIAQDVFIHHFGSKSFKADGEKKYAERLKINHKIFVDKWGADPDEIWLKQKPFNHSRNLFISINNDEFKKSFERAQNNIKDKEFDLAITELGLAIEKYDTSDKAYSIISKEDLLLLSANVSLIIKDLEKANMFLKKL
ncbi:MAG: glycosyltransferase family 2 protein [Ignavibacteriales bacterium]|nr:glycosyltransferase family 2 protein [Ignavibacteriales bacterium]